MSRRLRIYDERFGAHVTAEELRGLEHMGRSGVETQTCVLLHGIEVD
jgi:hypothetical protein